MNWFIFDHLNPLEPCRRAKSTMTLHFNIVVNLNLLAFKRPLAQLLFYKSQTTNLLQLNYSRAKYFRGRRIHQDWDIKVAAKDKELSNFPTYLQKYPQVDQAEFRELSVSAGSTTGVTANISSFKTGSKSVTWVQSRPIPEYSYSYLEFYHLFSAQIVFFNPQFPVS